MHEAVSPPSHKPCTFLSSLVQLARVGAQSSHLLAIQPVTKAQLAEECNKEHVDLGHVNRLLALLISQLQAMPKGHYLLTHQSGASAVSLLGTAAEDQDESQVQSYVDPVANNFPGVSVLYYLQSLNNRKGQKKRGPHSFGLNCGFNSCIQSGVDGVFCGCSECSWP